MAQGMEIDMEIISLVILGILQQKPLSAYDIQKLLEFRNLTRFVKISTPSVYKKVVWLEENGYLYSETKKNGKLPEKSVYSITEEGNRYLLELMEKASKHSINIFLDLNAIILNLENQPKEFQKQIIENINTGVQELSQLIKANMSKDVVIPPSGQCILEQQLLLVTTLEEWVSRLPGYFDCDVQLDLEAPPDN